VVATLAIDVGGTSIKAARVDGSDAALEARARRRTPKSVDPTTLLGIVDDLVDRLAPIAAIGLGFPGPVADGVVLDGANLVRTDGPGSPVDAEAAAAWRGFDLATALMERHGLPAVVVNDADAAAVACAAGRGVELTVTLGTGVGTGLVVDGILAPHVEHSETPLGGAATLDELVGEGARKRMDPAAWQAGVRAVLEHLDAVVQFDACSLAGGNARRVWRDGLGPLAERLTVVAAPVGLLGAATLAQQLLASEGDG
jgi:polyphosphate glucokinase